PAPFERPVQHRERHRRGDRNREKFRMRETRARPNARSSAAPPSRSSSNPVRQFALVKRSIRLPSRSRTPRAYRSRSPLPKNRRATAPLSLSRTRTRPPSGKPSYHGSRATSAVQSKRAPSLKSASSSAGRSQKSLTTSKAV